MPELKLFRKKLALIHTLINVKIMQTTHDRKVKKKKKDKLAAPPVGHLGTLQELVIGSAEI